MRASHCRFIHRIYASLTIQELQMNTKRKVLQRLYQRAHCVTRPKHLAVNRCRPIIEPARHLQRIQIQHILRLIYPRPLCQPLRKCSWSMSSVARDSEGMLPILVRHCYCWLADPARQCIRSYYCNSLIADNDIDCHIASL